MMVPCGRGMRPVLSPVQMARARYETCALPRRTLLAQEYTEHMSSIQGFFQIPVWLVVSLSPDTTHPAIASAAVVGCAREGMYNTPYATVGEQGNKHHENLPRRRELCRENHHWEA